MNIYLAEFPADRPFKPSKTVRRILVAAWGADTATYVGRRMTLFRDASVKFGGMDVGGIRISHLSHIDKAVKVALTVTRGKRAFHIVEPIPGGSEVPTQRINPDNERVIGEHITRTGLSRDGVLIAAQEVAGRPVNSARELTAAQADALIDLLAQMPDGAPEGDPTFPNEDGAA